MLKIAETQTAMTKSLDQHAKFHKDTCYIENPVHFSAFKTFSDASCLMKKTTCRLLSSSLQGLTVLVVRITACNTKTRFNYKILDLHL